MLKRLSLGLVDQFVSSLTNFVGVIAAARLLADAEFGRFGISSAIVLALVNLNRTAVAEPMSIALNADNTVDDDAPGIVRSAVSSTAVIAVCAAMVLAVASLATPGLLGTVGLVTAAFVPILLVHDTYRYALAAQDDHRWVLASDIVWLVWVAGAFVLVSDVHAAGWAMAMWLGGLVPALIVLLAHPIATGVGASVAFLRAHRAYVVPVVVGYLFIVLTGNLMPLVIGVVGDVELAGEYRLLQAVFGPVGVLVQASSLLGLPMLARQRRHGSSALAKRAAGIGALLAGAAVVWGALLFVLPEASGVRFFGVAWPDVRVALPYMVVFFCFQTIGYTSILVLQTMGSGGSVLRVRAFLGSALLAGALIGLRVAGSPSAILTGMAIAAAAAGVLWIGACRRALAQEAPSDASHGERSQPHTISAPLPPPGQ